MKTNRFTVNSEFRRHGILLDGHVQVTGAHFANNKQVAAAVRKLNKALAAGLDRVEVEGWRGSFLWIMKHHNQDMDVLPVNLLAEFWAEQRASYNI